MESKAKASERKEIEAFGREWKGRTNEGKRRERNGRKWKTSEMERRERNGRKWKARMSNE